MTQLISKDYLMDHVIDVLVNGTYEEAEQLEDIYDAPAAEPSDLISREKAIEAMELESAKDGSYGYIDIKSAVEMLESLPSADAVQGEWIDVENEPYCECSVCGSYIDNLDDDYAFCPRCGARMKGGAEE